MRKHEEEGFWIILFGWIIMILFSGCCVTGVVGMLIVAPRPEGILQAVQNNDVPVLVKDFSEGQVSTVPSDTGFYRSVPTENGVVTVPVAPSTLEGRSDFSSSTQDFSNN